MSLKSIGLMCLAVAALAGCTAVQKDGFTDKPDLVLATGAGKTIELNIYRHVKRDCTPHPLPIIKVVSQSGGGSIKQTRLTEVTGSNSFKGDYAHCSGMKVLGTAVNYTPKPGFVGVDRVNLEIYFADGYAWRQNFTINVR